MSIIAVGYILAQLNAQNRQCPTRFRSITWNEHIAQYSQSKLELYSFFWALKACKLWLVGAKKLKVEVNVKYIKGMINRPDIHPNTVMNW
ncbi:hypothetical protein AN958_07267 [Leucoagaricus sp. SymC.cos]|nr:hypothetical protein AN958_07267 [Leucoagaricus sp. SymC.cos]